jgi:hypothetical protein
MLKTSRASRRSLAGFRGLSADAAAKLGLDPQRKRTETAFFQFDTGFFAQ